MTDSNGLIHMRARHYNSEIKRFINRDILRGDIRDGQSLNRYAFVNGNPVNYIDPFGLSRDSDVGFGLRALDVTLDLIPIVGSIKSAVQAGTGYNLVTGERLSVTERGIEALGIIPFFKAGKAATGLTTGAIEAANKANRLTKGQADEIAGNPGLLRLDLQYFARGSSKGTGKVQTGGRELSIDEYLKQLDKAEKMYESFRKSKMDVQSIVKNTGMAEHRVQRIKEHLFTKEHIKEHGVGRFDADYEIAQAWDRLQRGTYKKNDIDLLNHELFESKFEGIFKTNYRTAHDRTVDSGRPWYPPKEE